MVNDGLRMMWNPDEAHLAQCEQFGREFAAAVKAQ